MERSENSWVNCQVLLDPAVLETRGDSCGDFQLGRRGAVSVVVPCYITSIPEILRVHDLRNLSLKLPCQKLLERKASSYKGSERPQ